MAIKPFFAIKQKTKRLTNTLSIQIRRQLPGSPGSNRIRCEKSERRKAIALLKTALKDKFPGLRSLAITNLDIENEKVKTEVENNLGRYRQKRSARLVKADAISALAVYNNPAYTPIFKAAVNDSSYTVAGNALQVLSIMDSTAALAEAKRMMNEPAKGNLLGAIQAYLQQPVMNLAQN